MDIIAEILDADRLAEETLMKAEKQCRDLAESAEAEKKRLEASLEESRAEFTAEAEADLRRKAQAASAEAEEREKAKTAATEKIFDENREKWADEIFSRITADI